MNIAILAPALLFGIGHSEPDEFIDPNIARSQAVAYERDLQWDKALLAWQSILDRSEPPESLRYEAIAHVRDLNLKTKPANTSLSAAKSWPTLVVIFRNVDATLKD